MVGTGAAIAQGSAADIKYRVLRLGKRSRDGLSGEASLVFSFGYGEDDDKESDVLNVKERHLSEPLPRAVRRDPRAFPRRPESEPAQAASPRSVTAAAAPPPLPTVAPTHVPTVHSLC